MGGASHAAAPGRKRRFDELTHDAVRDYSPHDDIKLPPCVRPSDEALMRGALAMALALKDDTVLLPHTFNVPSIDRQPHVVIKECGAGADGAPGGYYEVTVLFPPDVQFQCDAVRAIEDINRHRIRNIINSTDWARQRQRLQFHVYSQDAALPDEMLEMQFVRIKRVPRRVVTVNRAGAGLGSGLLSALIGRK